MHTKQTNGKDITTWVLPEGAIARLDRGNIRRSMAFSPDGASLAVATDIGCWWYDLATMAPHALWDTERGMVSAISFSPCARWVATGNWDGVVKVWDTQNLQCVAKIERERDRVVSELIFSPDGQHLAAASPWCSAVYAWRTNTDTPFASFTFPPKPGLRYNSSAITFSPDGSLFAHNSGFNVTSVLHVETGEIIAVLRDEYTEHPEGCDRLVFSPCGQYLTACNRMNKVHTWNVHNGTLEMAPMVYEKVKRAIPVYIPDGTLRVAGISAYKVVIRDATQQGKLDSFECWGGLATTACFSTDGTRFAINNRRGHVHVWTEGSPSTVTSLPGHPQEVSWVGFSKDSHTLVSAYKHHAGCRLWNVAQRQVKRTFNFLHPNSNTAGAMVISRDIELLATTEEEHTIKVWDVASDTQVAELSKNPSPVYAMAFSPTGKYLVTSGYRKPIKVWDVASDTQVAELSENPRWVSSLAFSPTGEYLISSSKESVTVWDSLRWEKRHVLHIESVNPVRDLMRFHPNGKSFVTAPREGPTLLWNLKSGEQFASLPTAKCLNTTLYKGTPQDIQRVLEQQTLSPRRLRALEFSPCGTVIAGGMMDEIRVWDATTLETHMAIIQPIGSQKLYALAFSPCSRYLASGVLWQEGQEKVAVRLWEVATGENIHTFWGHPTDVLCLAFSPDSALLASGGYDGTILLWDVKPFIGS